MCNEEVHCNVLTVHPLVHHLPDLLRHPVAIHIAVVLQREGGWGRGEGGGGGGREEGGREGGGISNCSFSSRTRIH